MKRYEKELLNNLSGSTTIGDEEPLKNVKKALGSLRDVVGNPMFKAEITLQISINYFFNLSPIAPAALPNDLQTTFPVFLLGLTDFYSGYPKGLNLIHAQNPWSPSDNIGYKEFSSQFTFLWFMAMLYDVADPNWAQLNGTLISNGNNGVMRINNFWVPGRLYKIDISVEPVNAGTLTMPYDGTTVPYPALSSSNPSMSYYYSPEFPQMQFDSNLFNGTITRLKIIEVSGIQAFSGEPAFGIYGFNKSTSLSGRAVKGDGIFHFVNFRPAPHIGVIPPIIYQNDHIDNYIAEVIIHCNNLAYGTFLNSFVSDLITVNLIRYFVPAANINQLINPLVFGYQTLFGKLSSDTIDPRMYQTPAEFQNQIADIPVKFPVDKNMLIGFNLNFDCPMASLILYVNKVEPLTLRR